MQARQMEGIARMRLVGIVLAAAAIAAATLFFYCPCSRLPGGYLLGHTVTAPVADWSFANAVPLCQIQVDAGLPHSINLNCMASGGALYLSCANCAGKRWSQAALARPEVRLRLGDAVYPVRLTRVEDAAELDVAWQARAAKLGMPTATPRAEGWWSFRVESRS